MKVRQEHEHGSLPFDSGSPCCTAAAPGRCCAPQRLASACAACAQHPHSCNTECRLPSCRPCLLCRSPAVHRGISASSRHAHGHKLWLLLSVSLQHVLHAHSIAIAIVQNADCCLAVPACSAGLCNPQICHLITAHTPDHGSKGSLTCFLFSRHFHGHCYLAARGTYSMQPLNETEATFCIIIPDSRMDVGCMLGRCSGLTWW